jgi:putative GTP pyrophosphokinase
MRFPPVPIESKSQINKAGQILINKIPANYAEREAGRALADRWRACHAYPINTFQSTLRRKLVKFSHDPIVAQRLKRMPTIIDKLQNRYSTMNLTQMQDIGGVRAVVNSIEDVYKLAKEYRESHFEHELIVERDYIKNPRREYIDGYRSLHLIYRYRNRYPPGKEYNGLLVELQIRTKRQHAWATTVEILGEITKERIKFREGSEKWRDFFAVTSSAFAHIEKTTLVPGYENLSLQETVKKIVKIEKELNVFDMLRTLPIVANAIEKEDTKRSSYYVVVLNNTERRVYIRSYGREDFEQADAEYKRIEKETETRIGEIDPVLVSAGSFESLKRAYPNYFLDAEEFIKNVTAIINRHAK